MKIFSLNLMGMRFFGNYGYYPEERKLTTELILDLKLTFQVPDQEVLQLEDSLNYETIYELTKSEMRKPEALIENIGIRIQQAIKMMDNRILNCHLKLYKKVQLGGPVQMVILEIED